MSLLDKISEALQEGDVEAAEEFVKNALNEGVSAQQILNDGLLKGMDVVGTLFKSGDYFVPDVLMSARVLNRAMEIIKGRLVDEGVKSIGEVVIATVEGDLHDIGKNLVRMMLEGIGINCIDLGVDVKAEVIVEAVKEYNPDILALSALLTTTMDNQKLVIQELEKAGLRDSVKIMIGGAPITQEFCDQIGADAYTPDASAAADKAKEVLRMIGA
jgi:5-methyltetrahydrofolate--homocysteine methyltransferase